MKQIRAKLVPMFSDNYFTNGRLPIVLSEENMILYKGELYRKSSRDVDSFYQTRERCLKELTKYLADRRKDAVAADVKDKKNLAYVLDLKARGDLSVTKPSKKSCAKPKTVYYVYPGLGVCAVYRYTNGDDMWETEVHPDGIADASAECSPDIVYTWNHLGGAGKTPAEALDNAIAYQKERVRHTRRELARITRWEKAVRKFLKNLEYPDLAAVEAVHEEADKERAAIRRKIRKMFKGKPPMTKEQLLTAGLPGKDHDNAVNASFAMMKKPRVTEVSK